MAETAPVVRPITSGMYTIVSAKYKRYVGPFEVSSHMDGRIVALSKEDLSQIPLYFVEENMKIQPVPGVPSTYSLTLNGQSVIVKDQQLFIRPELTPSQFYIQPCEGSQYIITEVPDKEHPEGLSLVWSLNEDADGAPVDIQPKSFQPQEGQTWFINRVEVDPPRPE